MLKKYFEKFIKLDYAELSIKSILSLFIGGILTYFVNVFKENSFSSKTLSYILICLFLITLWKCLFFYKHYQGNKLAGLYDWDNHCNTKRVEVTEERLAQLILEAKSVDLLLASGLHVFDPININDEDKISIGNAINKTSAKVRILLLDPDDEENCKKRREQILPINKDLTLLKFREYIKHTCDYIENLKNDGVDIQYKLYREKPVFRIVRIDHVLHVQSYIDARWSWQTACVGFSFLGSYNKKNARHEVNTTSLFAPFLQYFNELFERSNENMRKELRHNRRKEVCIYKNGVKIPVICVDESKNGLKLFCDQLKTDDSIIDDMVTIQKGNRQFKGEIRWRNRINCGYNFGIRIL